MTPAELIVLERLAEDAQAEAFKRYSVERNRTDSVTLLELAWDRAEKVAAGTLRLIEDYRREERETCR